MTSVESDDSNWFTHVIAKVPAERYGYQNHKCGLDIVWKDCTGIVTDQDFKTFVIMKQPSNISVYDLIKKGTVAVFSMSTEYKEPVSYFIMGSLIIFKFGSGAFALYDSNKEGFSLLADGNHVVRLDKHDTTLIFHLQGTTTLTDTKDPATLNPATNTYFQKNSICITDFTSNHVIIKDRVLVCSCHFTDKILILAEIVYPNPISTYQYYDLKRSSAIDVGNFVCWLPNSLSFFEYQTDMKMAMIKRFSKEPCKGIEDRCLVCFEDLVIKFALVPCGHTQFCETCIKKIDTCLLCKVKFTSIMRIY
jgi:hypothetical protein